MKRGQGQDVTPGIGADSNFFGDFFISQEELDGVDPSDVEESEGEDPELNEDTEEEEEEESESNDQNESDDINNDEEEEEEEEQSGVTITPKKNDRSQEDDSSEEDEDETSHQTMMRGFVDKGVLDWTDEEKVYDTGEEGLSEMISDTVENRLKERINEESKNRNPEVVALENYLSENPGRTAADFNNAKEDVSYSEVDETDPETAIYLLEDLYQLQGLNDDEIKQNIEEHRASKSIGRHAKRAKGVLTKYQEDNKKAESQARQVALQQEEAKVTENRRQFEQSILKSETVAGIKIDPKERQALADYIMKPVDDEGNTALSLEEASDHEAALLYAYIKKNKINLSKINAKAETKATIKFRKKINKHTDTLAKKKRSASSPQKDASPDDLSGLDDWNVHRK